MAADNKTPEQRAIELGIDVTLLEARLAMTPDERVRAHEAALQLAQKLAKAMEETRGEH